MFTYIRLVNFNVQIINGRKSPANVFSLFIVKNKNKNIIPLWPSYYKAQNPQNKIRQTALKHYNQFMVVRTDSLRWLQITTYTGNKIKI